jgi:hypothetical protein
MGLLLDRFSLAYQEALPFVSRCQSTLDAYTRDSLPYSKDQHIGYKAYVSVKRVKDPPVIHKLPIFAWAWVRLEAARDMVVGEDGLWFQDRD